MGLKPLQKEEKTWDPSVCMQQAMEEYNQEEAPHRHSVYTGALILGLAFRTVKNKCLLFKPPSRWYSGTVAQTNWDSHSRGVTGTQWVEVRDSAKYPSMHRTAATIKNYLPQPPPPTNVNSERLRNPGLAVALSTISCYNLVIE